MKRNVVSQSWTTVKETQDRDEDVDCRTKNTIPDVKFNFVKERLIANSRSKHTFFFDGNMAERIVTQNQMKTQAVLNDRQSARHASLNRSAASGDPPSAPATACKSLGPAKSDVANALAQEMESMRDHRFRQARNAD